MHMRRACPEHPNERGGQGQQGERVAEGGEKACARALREGDDDDDGLSEGGFHRAAVGVLGVQEGFGDVSRSHRRVNCGIDHV